ncbi:MAG: hypothetical protein HRT88_13260, partial [Lentisphaeraceae bacterium]|nr:hypothetical protein [Lentisphaeraceae bacterium]
HPHYFKKSISFKTEISQQFFSAQKKYSKKDIQLKGIITKLRDNKKGKLLIEIDHYFVADINISSLKPESVSLLKNKLDTYSNQKDPSFRTTAELKFLIVSLRGTCILKDNKTYITKCTSLIAEEVPFFYTD